MTVREFYRRSLAAPMLVPLVLAFADFVLGYRGPGHQAMRILEEGAAIGAIPYLLTCAAALRWMRRRPEGKITLLTLASPVLYAAVLMALALPLVLARGAGVQAPIVVLVYGGLALLIGYGYVLATHVVLGAMRLAGSVHPEPQPA